MKIFLSLCLLVLCSAFVLQDSFLAQQKKFARVRTAISEKEASIKSELSAIGLAPENVQILLVAYKEEEELHLYVKKASAKTYEKLKSFDICASSGSLGPKRQQGDGQVPEGFYHIDRFNPSSNFYLSMGINYPNASDKKKGKAGSLGGDIFIHGSCVTIGCLPMTDDKIKELYLYAVYAKTNGQSKIPVYIFPFKMSEDNMKKYEKDYQGNTALIAFWKNLKVGYDSFIQNKKEPLFSVNAQGDYTF